MAKTQLSTCYAALGRRCSSAHWSGQVIFTPRLNHCATRFAAGLNMKSRGYRGGRRISAAVFMAVIFTTKFHELLIRAGSSGASLASDRPCTATASANLPAQPYRDGYRPVPYRCAERVSDCGEYAKVLTGCTALRENSEAYIIKR